MPREDMKKPLIRGGANPQHLGTSVSGPGTPLVGILGTGDFSRSLAKRLVASGYRVVVGSRNPKRCVSLFPEEAEVTTQQEAATQADLVFVALFPEHYSTLAGLKEPLAGKTLVDVSNGTKINKDKESYAEQLANLFPESSVVKGFNVISAWSLQTGPRDGSRQVLICGDSSRAKNAVIDICHSLGFTPVDTGRLSSAREIENAPLYLFPSWRPPFLSTLVVFLFFYAYNFLRDVLHPYVTEGKSAFYKMPVEVVNVSLPSAALVTLALVYLPGLIAAFLQLSWGTKYRRFPGWLDCWLRLRKQLGLCAFFCAAMHAVYSLCLPMRRSARYKLLNEAFKQVKAGQEDVWVEEEVWRMELYLSLGILALGVLSLLAISSLPTVANSLNWREFSFVQSRLGYTALVIATLHTLTYGWTRGLDPKQYRFYLPPTFLLVLAVPLAVLLGRLALSLPCAALRLHRIRRGWERSRAIRFSLPGDECNGGLQEDISRV
ncbi:metalloreductase STEAP3 [Esox lucius]|uniref:STEAP3 metalloreductase n=1 Tax=Esox lucius TaxID=8010 RepID=A0A3P9AHD9_ESOLU|nr:metalloreductase STEAP3 [Esox lucius]XP_019897605.1 metalloreductase STEAP3 [Esox lucius]